MELTKQKIQLSNWKISEKKLKVLLKKIYKIFKLKKRFKKT